MCEFFIEVSPVAYPSTHPKLKLFIQWMRETQSHMLEGRVTRENSVRTWE